MFFSRFLSRTIHSRKYQRRSPHRVEALEDRTLLTSILDVDNDGQADPGDTIRYTVEIQNTGTSNATNVLFDDTIDANTRPGKLKVNTWPVSVASALPIALSGDSTISK